MEAADAKASLEEVRRKLAKNQCNKINGVNLDLCTLNDSHSKDESSGYSD